MPAASITSITLATTWNSMPESPLTNAVRSARRLKISSRRLRKEFHVTGCSLILSDPPSKTWITMMLGSGRRWRGIRQRQLRYFCPQTRLMMRDDHEDHQQHQQNIDQRNHIHFRNDSAIGTTNRHAHESPRCTAFAPRGGLSQPCENPEKRQRDEDAALNMYWPASILAVIRPTLSMPLARMISMARATLANSTSLSPFTKAIFSARSLKI